MLKDAEQISSELDLLSDRVSDIEKCIGDFAEIFGSLKVALAARPGPLCPPYCAHGVISEEEDDLPLELRVADIKRCIGDFAAVFEDLKQSLSRRPGPLCPPYCSHPVDGYQT
ncbi:MAG: hypothetical protein ACREA9_06605 [Pyrinomonadaceae bacterium]